MGANPSLAAGGHGESVVDDAGMRRGCAASDQEVTEATIVECKPIGSCSCMLVADERSFS